PSSNLTPQPYLFTADDLGLIDWTFIAQGMMYTDLNHEQRHPTPYQVMEMYIQRHPQQLRGMILFAKRKKAHDQYIAQVLSEAEQKFNDAWNYQIQQRVQEENKQHPPPPTPIIESSGHTISPRKPLRVKIPTTDA